MNREGTEPVCHACDGPPAEGVAIHRCPYCHRYFCDEHAHLRSGRRFCRPYCADMFFFGDEEDTDAP